MVCLCYIANYQYNKEVHDGLKGAAMHTEDLSGLASNALRHCRKRLWLAAHPLFIFQYPHRPLFHNQRDGPLPGFTALLKGIEWPEYSRGSRLLTGECRIMYSRQFRAPAARRPLSVPSRIDNEARSAVTRIAFLRTYS